MPPEKKTSDGRELHAPHRVVEQLLAGIAAGLTPALAELYAANAEVELPFAQPGGLWLHGREDISQHFARAGRIPLRRVPERVVLHETSDPDVVIAEYDYRGTATRTERSFVASNVQIIRVRDGLIISSRDYHDHSVLAAALHSLRWREPSPLPAGIMMPLRAVGHPPLPKTWNHQLRLPKRAPR